MADIAFNPATIPIQVGLFGAAYVILKKWIFNPYLKLLGARGEKTLGLFARAKEDKAKALELKSKYESYMLEERKKIAHLVEAEKSRILKSERQGIQEARDSVAKELDGVRQSVKAQVESAEKSLAPLVPEFASEISSKLLGQKVEASQFSPASPSSKTLEGVVS